jgi:tetratricopeptide (TPR) repeat protein
VQRAGKLLRVTAQLTDTNSNTALWSLKLDRTIEDVFELQDQIALRVAQQLDVTLQRTSARYAQFGTDAYLAFVQGRALIESRKVNDVAEAARLFSRAIELAPTFAAAMAELALAKWQLASLQPGAPAQVAAIEPELDALVNRAIEIDPTAGEPYLLRAVLASDLRSNAAEADFLKGLGLAPNFGPGLRGYADYLTERGRYDEALVQLDRARIVDPLSAENHYKKGEMLRTVYLRYDEAATYYLQAISVQPEFYPAYTRLATVRWEVGRLAEAIQYAEKSIAIEPAIGWSRNRLVWFYVDLGDLGAARDVLRGYSSGDDVTGPEAALCYRAGKIKQAVGILLKNVNNEQFIGGYAALVTTNALVEQTIANKDTAVGRRALTSILQSQTTADLAIQDDSFPVILQLATLEHIAGSQAVGNDLAQRALGYLDRGPDVHLIAGWDEWARAAANSILGRDELALDHLETLVRSGFRVGWWSRIERDPAFSALRSTPRFQAIVAGSREWLRHQEEQLSQMRSTGEVPRRSSDQLTANGC